MAEELEVSRETIGNWERDKIKPKRLYLRAWAEVTAVPLGFLTHDNLRLVHGEIFVPKAGAGDARTDGQNPNQTPTPAAKTAGERAIPDNNQYPRLSQQPRKHGRKLAKSSAETHRYQQNTCHVSRSCHTYCRPHSRSRKSTQVASKWRVAYL
jgi:transcriptional regulator with XRE-family HTH domain